MRPGSPRATEFEGQLNEARRGCPVALGRVLKTVERLLRNHARREMGPELAANVSDSDCVQDTFLQAQRSLAQFRGRTAAEFFGWLCRIQSNNLRDYRRHIDRQKRQPADALSLDAPAAAVLKERLAATSCGPEDVAARGEEREAVTRAMEELPAPSRLVLQLHFLDGRPFAEVGQCLRCSAEAARKLCVRAMKSRRAVEPGPR